jgi:hypothetical protein
MVDVVSVLKGLEENVLVQGFELIEKRVWEELDVVVVV